MLNIVDDNTKNNRKMQTVAVVHRVQHQTKNKPRQIEPRTDPDEAIDRWGNRSPWGSPNNRIGEVRVIDNHDAHEPLERRSFICSLTEHRHVTPCECHITLLTNVNNEMYACAVRSGPEFLDCAPLRIEILEDETAQQAALRLASTCFPTSKPVRRAVSRACTSPPISVEYLSQRGAPVRAAQWAVWLTTQVALHLPAPVTPMPENAACKLDENASAKWMPVEAYIAMLQQLPYAGAVSKAAARCIGNLATAQGIPPPRTLSSTEARALRYSPKFISDWLRSVQACSLANTTDKQAWSIDQIPSPTINTSTLPQLVAAAQRLPHAMCGQKELQAVVNAARDRAQGHGCQQISARDLIEASQALRYEVRHDGPRPIPAQSPPQHYPELRRAIARLGEIIQQDEDRGIGRPWVLVCCEKSAIIALQFKLAGCQVATADLCDSADPSIDHFKGDARRITHLGFDLIIATPPCTHLCNASVVWLCREPHRWESMRQSAELFRELYNSDAPFVCLENPPMSRYARQQLNGLKPTQIVHPHEHGHGTSKPTALFIRGALPPLKPTCLMTGRDKSLRNVPPCPERGEIRGVFWMGIASAMSCQWCPTLIQHNRSKTSQRARPNLSEIIRECNIEEQRRLLTDPVVATIVSREGVNHNKMVAAVSSKQNTVPTTWVVCPHGAVLVGGDEENLEDLTSDDPLPRCTNAACVRDAETWWVNQQKAKAYCKEKTKNNHDDEIVYINKADAAKDPNHRPYPIKRIGKKGSVWYAWAPFPQKGSSGANYKWSRLGEKMQKSLGEEVDRLRRSRLANEGYHTYARSSPLYPPLSTIFSDNSVGFKEKEYDQEHGHHSDGHAKWDELRKNQQERYCTCQTCGAKRNDVGAKTCKCGDSAAMGATPEKKSGNATRKPPFKMRPIKFVAAQTPTPDEEGSKPPTLIAAIPKRHEVPLPLARQVSSLVKRAASYGIAKTPVKGCSEAHCAYVQNVMILDSGGEEIDKSYNVACFVRYALGDTGAGISVIASDLLKLLPPSALSNLIPLPAHHDSGVQAANGSALIILGTVELTFFLAQRIYCHKFQIIEGEALLILGNDFIASHQGCVAPRLASDKSKGYIEVNHEPSGTRVRSPLVATPSAWKPLRECSGPRAAPQVGGDNGEHAEPQQKTQMQVTVLGAMTAISHKGIKSTQNEYVDVSMSESDVQDTTEADIPGQHKDFVEMKVLEGPDPTENELYSKHLIKRDHVLVTQTPMQIPARSERVISVRLPKTLIHHTGDLLILPLPYRDGLGAPPVMVAASVCQANGEFIPIKLLNTSRRVAHLAELTAIATIEADIECPADGTPANHEYTWDTLTPSQREVIETCEIDPDKTLSENQLKRVRDLLAQNINVFAKNTKVPGVTHLLEVSLELRPGARPHKHAPSKMGSVGAEIAQTMVDDMLTNGIIRKSNSPWASRLVIVKKKNGDNRCCVDLRDLNSKLLIQDTPLPRCDTSIARLASAPDWKNGRKTSTAAALYFSVLDLCQGFHCLAIKEEDKEKLAFVTERGKYEYNYLPFGVNCGPSYMQRLMECALDGLAWETCIIYMDDIAVFSAGNTRDEAFEQQLSRLSLVLERLRWANLTVKPSKCRFLALSVEYLGHVVSQRGVSPNPKLVQGVMNINPREVNSIETVRSFLGLTGYYRQFVKDYHLISGPLTVLTKKNVNVPYESQLPEAQNAIIQLKEALSTAPVLAAPRDDREFIVHTDAATGHGIGGILIQHEDGPNGEHAEGGERPISYYGRRCTGAESNYTVTECELLAVIESIKHFRPYLWGRHFVIVTDHSALRWLNTMKESVNGGASSRLTRWSLHLMEYSFTVKHKAGKLHQDADAISRLVGCIRKRSDAITDMEQTQPQPHVNAALDLVKASICSPNHIEELVHAGSTANNEDAAFDMQSAVAALVLRGEAYHTNHDVKLPENIRVCGLTAHEAFQKACLNSDVPRAETLKNEQLNDADCTDILNYIVSGCSVADAKRLQWISKNAEHCQICNGLLCHTAQINSTTYHRVWIPAACRQQFLIAFHDQLGHPSQERMYKLMQRSVYWPGMSSDVIEHATSCHECSFSKKGSRKHGMTRPPQVGSYPFEIMIADILSMKKTEDGYTKIIIFACSLSRWIEAIPLKKDPSSKEILDIFMHHVVCRHGVPRCVRSDCGSNLTSKLCQEIYKLCGVELAQSTAYHHSSLGIVERINSTLTEMTKASDPTQQNWAKHLPFICFAYNATPHRVTRESPACLIYGRDLRLFQNMDLHAAAPSRDERDLSEYARQLYNRIRLAWDVALQHTHAAQGAEAERLDVRKNVNTTFVENDRVLMKVETPHLNKLSYKYSGPFRIAEVLEKGVYRLRDLHSRRTIDRVNVDRLRKYQTYTDFEPVAPEEYIVQKLLDHREVDEGRQFLVHWRGFRKNEATWTNEDNLLKRCSDLVTQYLDNLSPAQKRAQTSKDRRDASKPNAQKEYPSTKNEKHSLPTICPFLKTPETAQTEAGTQPTTTAYPSDVRQAQYVRGAWGYLTYFPTTRGLKQRWLPTAHFTSKEQELLKPLRQQYLDSNPLASLVASLTPSQNVVKSSSQGSTKLSLRGGGPKEPDEPSCPINRCLTNPDIISLIAATTIKSSQYIAIRVHRITSTTKQQIQEKFVLKRLSGDFAGLQAMTAVCKQWRTVSQPIITTYKRKLQYQLRNEMRRLQQERIDDIFGEPSRPFSIDQKRNQILWDRPIRWATKRTSVTGWHRSILLDNIELLHPPTLVELIQRSWYPMRFPHPYNTPDLCLCKYPPDWAQPLLSPIEQPYMTSRQLGNSIDSISRLGSFYAQLPLTRLQQVTDFGLHDEEDKPNLVTSALYCVYGQAYMQAEVIARYKKSPKITLRGGGPKLLNKNHKSDGSPSTSCLVAIPTEAIPILEYRQKCSKS